MLIKGTRENEKQHQSRGSVDITEFDQEGFLCVSLITLGEGVRVFAEGLFLPEYEKLVPVSIINFSLSRFFYFMTAELQLPLILCFPHQHFLTIT